MGVHVSRIQSLELDKLGTSELLVSSVCDLYFGVGVAFKFIVMKIFNILF